MNIEWNRPIAKLIRGQLSATVSSGVIRFAHLGCKLPDSSLPLKKILPAEYAKVESLLDGLYGSRSQWKRKEPSTLLLGQTLQRLIQATGAEGIHLIETMRKGSDHWRPGRLITDA